MEIDENVIIQEIHQKFVDVLILYGFEHITHGDNKSTQKVYRFYHHQLDFILHMTKASQKLSIVIPKSYQSQLIAQSLSFDFYSNSNLKGYPKEENESTQTGL